MSVDEHIVAAWGFFCVHKLLIYTSYITWYQDRRQALMFDISMRRHV